MPNEEREKEILTILEKKYMISVKELADLLFVSEPTIRRDLSGLPGAFELRKPFRRRENALSDRFQPGAGEGGHGQDRPQRVSGSRRRITRTLPGKGRHGRILRGKNRKRDAERKLVHTHLPRTLHDRV